MNKLVMGVLVIALLAGGGYAHATLNGSANAQTQVAAPTPAPEATEPAAETVVVDAAVVPLEHVSLNFAQGLSHIVGEVLVKEGAKVKKGDVLAKLDTRDLQLKVEQAEVAVAQAQASYDKFIQGATPEEIAAAQAQVAQVQGQLRQARGSVTSHDIAAAQAEVEAARAILSKLEAGPKTGDVQAARARLDQARATLAEAEAGPKAADLQAALAALDQARANFQLESANLSTAKTSAYAAIETSSNAVRDCQAEYSRLYWDNREFEATGETLEQVQIDAEAASLRAVENAQNTLTQAQVAYDQARQAEIDGVAAAQARVAQAQANYDKVLTSVDTSAVAAARADVAQAQANLDNLLRVDGDQVAAARARLAQAQASLAKLRGDQHAGSIAASAAGVENAQAVLAQLTADPGAPDIAEMQSRVDLARVSLKAAELALDDATLRTPISGTVAEVNLKPGEMPSALNAAVIVADISLWQIETSDLTELDVVHIAEGAPVIVTFDALSGVELRGTVQRVKPIGKTKQGDITYTAVIALDQTEARLRWNMTASVMFEVN